MRALDPDTLLAEAAALLPPAPDTDFMARLMADAQRLQPPLPMSNVPRTDQPRPDLPHAELAPPMPRSPVFGPSGVLDVLAEVFGGRGALAAMMLATVTGLYLGAAQPTILTRLTGDVSVAPLDHLDLMSGSDSLWTETIQ